MPLFDPGASLGIPMRDYDELNRSTNEGLAQLCLPQNPSSFMPFSNTNHDSSISIPSPFVRFNRYGIPHSSNILPQTSQSHQINIEQHPHSHNLQFEIDNTLNDVFSFRQGSQCNIKNEQNYFLRYRLQEFRTVRKCKVQHF